MNIELEAGVKQVVLPAGRYVIGDPCYHVPDEEWDHVLSESNFFEGQCWSHFETKAGTKGTVVAFSTAYGDGEYEDAAGRKYPVDAGLIGIIPLDDVAADLDLSCAHVITFTAPFTCRERAGKISFGFIDIDTDPSDPMGDLDEDDFYRPRRRLSDESDED